MGVAGDEVHQPRLLLHLVPQGRVIQIEPAPAGRLRVTRLDDQHAYLSVPAESLLAPGDLLCLGISHPCTTMDKWRVIPVTDEQYQVIDAVHTFF